MIYELDKLNKEMKDDPAGFARKCDADLDRRLRKCAEEVAGHLSDVYKRQLQLCLQQR